MKKKFIIYKKVGTNGYIGLPRTLAGQDVEISFTRNLTEEEIKKLELSKVIGELRVLREKRKK